MRYHSLSILLLGALAACDSDPLAPEPPAMVQGSDVPAELQSETAAELASSPMDDVFARIVPALEDHPGANGLRLALDAADDHAIERILVRLEADPENAPEVSVIRLALQTR